MDKKEWLFHLRRCSKRETLERIIEYKLYGLSPMDVEFFISAADHRRAELVMGKLYDKVPKQVWGLIS